MVEQWVKKDLFATCLKRKGYIAIEPEGLTLIEDTVLMSGARSWWRRNGNVR